MRKTAVAVMIGAAFMLAGCGQIAPEEEEIPLIRQIVQSTNEEFAICMADGDAGCLAGFFADDGWQLRSNTRVVIGQQDIQRYWQQTLPGGTWELILETGTVEESGPLAIERGKYTLSFTVDPAAASMRTSFLEKGHYLTHWRFDTAGRWFIVAQALVAEVTGREGQGQSSVDSR